MKRLKNLKYISTFSKMLISFVFLGMLPLLLIGILFLLRFGSSIEGMTVDNYSQIGYYLEKNVTELIDSVDDAMGQLYDYSLADYGTLNDVLKNDSQNETEKRIYINQMLQSILAKSEYVSSARFVDQKYQVYSVFAEQGKTIKDEPSIYAEYNMFDGQNQRALYMLRAVDESTYCVNTDDFVFTLVRNCLDTSSISSIYSDVLGTLYVDVNVEKVDDLVENIDVGEQGGLYIYNMENSSYTYSREKEDYINGNAPLAKYEPYITGSNGNAKVGEEWIFYNQIEDTQQYVVIRLNNNDILGSYFRNRSVMILVLTFSAFILLVIYMLYSGKLSETTRKLKQAMEKLQTGNMDVYIETKGHGEMEYVAEGFNKMVEDLRYYIEQVYVAELCQKEAELDALKMQIEPHFLYNTLDVIRMTAVENNDVETAKLIESLAFQLRYIMGHHNDVVTIRKEVEMLREYFVIVKARYQNRINLQINMSDEDAELHILKLVLQPLVENAIKHGLREKKGKGTVLVSIGRQQDYLEIIVMDDGIGMSKEKLNELNEALEQTRVGQRDENSAIGVGVKNSYDRIKLNCGAEYGFTVTSVEDMGTIVTFKLPIWEEEPNVTSHISG